MKPLLVALAVWLLALPASGDDDFIQFMGIMTFVAPNTGVEAILPHFDGDEHIAAHDAIILFRRKPDKVVDWPIGKITIHNTVSGTPVCEKWYYVELRSATVTFNRDRLPEKDRPMFLPHLNDGCCRWIYGLDDDYEKHGSTVASQVVLPFSKLSVGKDPPKPSTPSNPEPARFDTVARFEHLGALEITATFGSRKPARQRTLVFSDAVQIVIANLPIDVLKGTSSAPNNHDHPHFSIYYKMANLGRFCSDRRNPDVLDSCKPEPAPGQVVPLILGIRTVGRGEDINCSNSTYP